jgi:cell shape-determining protein MreC
MLSRFPIPCPECHQTVRIRTEYIGLRVQCNRCGRPFTVPRTVAVACPGCGVHETFRTEDLGRVIRCNRCNAVHEVTAVGADGGAGIDRAAAPSSDSRSERPDPLGIEHLHDDPRRFLDPEADRDARDEAAWREPIGAGQGSRDDRALHAELEEARSQLDRLRSELDSLRSGTSEAGRLAAEYGALKEEVDEKSRRQEELRTELEERRSEFERLEAEAAALRDRAASAERLEDELRAARAQVARLEELERLASEAVALRDRAAAAEQFEHELQAARREVERLQADYEEARGAAATATREVADLLDHSANLQDGFYRALAEIEANPTETLIPPQEAERLRARLGELEGQVAEAATARRAVEDDLARKLQVREHELETVREQLRTLQAQVKELAALEAEEARLRTLLGSDRRADDEIAAEVAQHLGSVPALPARAAPGRRPAQSPPPAREPVVRPMAPANRPGRSDHGFALPASDVVAAPGVDVALEFINLRELLPQLMDVRESKPAQAAAERPAPAVQSGIGTGPVADRHIPRQPEPAAGPPLDLNALKAEALRLRADVLERISQGRKKEAEVLARRMVELTRTIAGELSPDHSTWMTVVGQLQAEQGDWAGARATFNLKGAAFRDRFGERDPRYLNCVAESAEALLACGDNDGAQVLFEAAEALCRLALDAAHPLATSVRRKLDHLRGHGHNVWTVRAST